MFIGTLTVEELESYAKKAAIRHDISYRRGFVLWPLKRVNANMEYLNGFHHYLNEEIRKRRLVPQAAEWILDNFYIMEEQIKCIQKDLSKKEYSALPILKKGQYAGNSRILIIILEFVSLMDGQIDEENIVKYFEAYQKHSVLFDREIRMIPMMIQIALLENIRKTCEQIKETQLQWKLADNIMDKYWTDEVRDEAKMITSLKKIIDSSPESKTSFLEHLFYRLRRAGTSYVKIQKWADDYLYQFGITLDNVTQMEHNAQAIHSVSVGNAITGYKNVAGMNWVEIFEELSYVERILRNDPNGMYKDMTSESKRMYIHELEKTSKFYRVSERHIAQLAIQLAQQVSGKGIEKDEDINHYLKRSHVGYYILGEGRKRIDEIQNKIKKPAIINLEKVSYYEGVIYFVTFILLTLLILYFSMGFLPQTKLTGGFLTVFIVGILFLIPSTEISMVFVNFFVSKLKKPCYFPCLELKNGIHDNLKTMVVVPAIISNTERLGELMHSLETHYLSNRDDNIYFALLGGFKDSNVKDSENANQILQQAKNQIDSLNQQYTREGEPIFYYFHRKNVLNVNEKTWTGWERKRGALMEFNDFLRGSKDTSFLENTSFRLSMMNIKYVITLDADTQLPIGMAKKMIGTMAHPNHLPVIDHTKQMVVEGHGLMQPKIAYDVESIGKTKFAKLYSGQSGIDPYANYTTDVYQDLFDEGIFTGKGIYDVSIFRDVLKDVVPENTVLSHDLLEGIYVRAAFVSNIELVDSYPAKYFSYIARQYRWIRGDWQLIPWLKKRVINRNEQSIENPITNISSWKIIDNLRRSLVAPSILILLSLTLLFCNEILFFSLFFIGLVFFFPLLLELMEHLYHFGLNIQKRRSLRPLFLGIENSFLKILLAGIFMIHQAFMNLHAIITTLIRVLFTRKKLLEWVTSDDIEKQNKDSLKSYFFSMKLSLLWVSFVLGAVILLGYDTVPVAIIVAMIGWMAPIIAWFLSLDIKQDRKRLDADKDFELYKIARKTWGYFETFVNLESHYLAVDNYQEEPYRGVAHRTSPTNIGFGLLAIITAKDLGFIGFSSMLQQLANTMNTIKKLEKWHGHLYNWYNTKNLEPLKPYYISTVDSGNFVCYLITLRESLKEYQNRMLVEPVHFSGIKATYACDDIEREPLLLISEIEKNSTGNQILSVSEYYKCDKAILHKLRDTCDTGYQWMGKVEEIMVESMAEVDLFFPWLSLLDEISLDHINPLIQVEVEKLLVLLDSPISLNLYEIHCKKILQVIKNVLEFLSISQDSNSLLMLEWLHKVEEKVQQGFEEKSVFENRYQEVLNEINKVIAETFFKQLYEPKRHLFSIGYSFEYGRLSNSYYDLLASEARQTSYLAIASGEIESKHWNRLGRNMAKVGKHKGLKSWSGTMFEYFMPFIIMKNYKHTLWDATYAFVIKTQIKYGKDRNVPWGLSESGFASINLQLDYQYKAIGIPWLGLKRGLMEDIVTAPYATFLTLPFFPTEAYCNIMKLKHEGMLGKYGYYEAIDFTTERLGPNEKSSIVKSYMAHHEGMSLLSINNYLNNKIFQTRFFADPSINAAKLLLQEKIPQNHIVVKQKNEKVLPLKSVVAHDSATYRRYTEPDLTLPNVHILSNGFYTVLATDRGTGYSCTKEYWISRWRPDMFHHEGGMYFYIKNKSNAEVWSAAYAPINQAPKDYEVVFKADRMILGRTNGLISTQTEIIVASGDNAEIRRIELKNNDNKDIEFEITSYFEIVMDDRKGDEAHQAFRKLFIETEYCSEYKALIAHRRKRDSSDKDLWIGQMAIVNHGLHGEVSYESDRKKFIGRGHTLKNPMAMEVNQNLSNSVGGVLDPIFSLRIPVQIPSEGSSRISFVTMTGNNREEIMELFAKYNAIENCDAAFWLAVIRSQVENKYLNLKAREMELYQVMISDLLFLSPRRRKNEIMMKQNKRNQKTLWGNGISGDNPIVLLTLNKLAEVVILYDLLKAQEYWRLKDLRVDLIIIVLEEYSYENPIFSMVKELIEQNIVASAEYRKGDIFILNLSQISREETILLKALSRLSFDGGEGTIESQLDQSYTKEISIKVEKRIHVVKDFPTITSIEHTTSDLLFSNGIGGFNKENGHYEMELESNVVTPAPWSNIIANEAFGFLATESGGGYTWCHNSQENRLTPWSNDPVCDEQGEVFYLSNENQELWSLTKAPIQSSATYYVEHGYGYTSYQHSSHGISHNLTQFVPLEGQVKLNLISLTNETEVEQHLKITYYIEPVLGQNRTETAMHLFTDITKEGVLTAQNGYHPYLNKQVLIMDTSVVEKTYTGNRSNFLGAGGKESPDELLAEKLSNTIGAGFDPCMAIQVEVKVPAKDTVQLVCLLGLSDEPKDIETIINKYCSVESALQVLEEAKEYWNEKLTRIQIKTPDLKMDCMMNGHLLYQVISCRLRARTGFYQSSGAYGFRDQLQDCLALLEVWPERSREQILKHAAHQFVEGDVLHWWHEPDLKGSRTRISDDFLWLPYVVAQYLNVVGDDTILREDILYLDGELLKINQEEQMMFPKNGEKTGSVYNHCLQAIKNGFHFGVHGLPLMGTGDWNDGMNRVGSQGTGESIWLAWFLLDILKKWVSICEGMKDMEHGILFQKQYKKIKKAVEEFGWDGEWYRRAYFDNGLKLGSRENQECKIDSLAQSWAVLSEAGNMERAKQAMSAVDEYLVDRKAGIIKLLTPPFGEGELEPGYIKGYLPGIRENGGQYTHAATWVVGAFAKLGEGEKAMELFSMLNPIHHSDSKEIMDIYQTEPYCMTADVYGVDPYLGKGGWSWYTGAASWMYQVGLQQILGFQKKGDTLFIDPCIPKSWSEFTILYKYLETVYEIEVKNPEGIEKGVKRILQNETELCNKAIQLMNDKKNHQIVVFMGE